MDEHYRHSSHILVVSSVLYVFPAFISLNHQLYALAVLQFLTCID